MSLLDEIARHRAYSSKLRDWDERASVRAKPRRMVGGEGDANKAFFLSELVPIIHHPAVRARGADVAARLVVHHLYRYLDFTAALEHEAVNPVVKQLARNGAELGLPDEMTFDAFKIYTDEAHHAYAAVDLKRQVVQATGVVPLGLEPPPFLTELRRLLAGRPSEERQLLHLFFVLISETLITQNLARATDVRLVPAVRSVLADHAEDEARHQAYFAALLGWVWPTLSRAQRLDVGVALPRYMQWFLTPDLTNMAFELRTCGIADDEARAVVAESYPAATVLQRNQEATRFSMTLLDSKGVLDEPRIRAAFEEAGLARG